MNDLASLSLRISLTEGCQLRCQYCRPAHAALMPVGPFLDAAEWMRRIRAVCKAVGIGKIRFTGGEPLLYPQMPELIAGCAELGISDLALTTNGIRLASQAKALRRSGLERINISLDSLDEGVFRRMTGGSIRPVLAGIQAAKEAGLPMKLNSVILRGFNDDRLFDLLEFGAREEIPVRFLELMPIGPSASSFDSLYVSGSEMMERIQDRLELEQLPYVRGETSRNYQVHWPSGKVSVCGFILPTSTPFCDGCRRLRLCADGALVGCLAQPDRLGLNEEFAAAEEGDFMPLRKRIGQAMNIKVHPQRFREQRAMDRIGG